MSIPRTVMSVWTAGISFVFWLTVGSAPFTDIDHRMGLLVMAAAEVCLWAVGTGIIFVTYGADDRS